MKKKVVWAVVSVVVVLGLLAGGFGCAQPAAPALTTKTVTTTATVTSTVTKTTAVTKEEPTPTPTPTPTPVTPTPAAPEIEPITLVLQDNAPPPGGARSQAVQWWMDEVTKRSNGKITFDAYWAESLVPVKETLPAVGTGLADCGMITTGYFIGQLPLHNLGNIPAGAASDYASVHAFCDLYEEFPEMRAELTRQGVKMLWMSGMPPMQLQFTKPVRTLEDMKGLKVRTYGLSAKMVEAWGATPVAMPFTEIYEALKLGTIDGAVVYFYTQRGYRHYEVAKWFIEGNFGALPIEPFIINLKTWESLGPEGQKILQEVSDEAQDLLIDLHKKEDVACAQLMKDAGVEIYKLPAEVRAKWLEKAYPIWDDWAKEMDTKGLPGTEIVTRYLELAEKYQKEIEK